MCVTDVQGKSNSGCRYLQRRYVAKEAQAEYEKVLKESREGIPLSKQAFYDTEQIISKAVLSGQHIYHAVKSNNIPVSISTVYRHINNGYYSISPLDLPRAVKFKPRHPKATEYIPKKLKISRSFEKFIEFIDENDISSFVEMDTLIGRVGGKVIMTLHFTQSDFMVGILMENKTSAEFGSKIIALKEQLKKQGFSFGDIFPLLLTDNGGEFGNVFAFENNSNGNRESRVFFCDPNKPYQKPHIENNHTLFRNIAPQGSSFDNFTQETVNKIFSHVNSVKRKQFNGKSSYEMFTFTYSIELATALGISYIEPQKVVQNTSLLK